MGGNPTQRYYLSVHATTTGFGAVSFQLEEADEDKLERAGKGLQRGRKGSSNSSHRHLQIYKASIQTSKEST